MRLSLVTNWSLYHMEGGGDVDMGSKTEYSNSSIKKGGESKYSDTMTGDQKICSPTIADSGYHSDSSTSRTSSQSSTDADTCQRKNGEGEASGDEMAQNGSPKRLPIDPLVSPASDVEEDVTNPSQRLNENEEKDCDSSRSSSPEDNEESETGNMERLMNCPYCERSYKRLTSLREHVKRRHEVNNFSCPQCNYCFAFKSQLERHMSTHMPGRDQVCGVCNRAFADIYRLQRHMLIHASGNRRFPCGECGKAFKYKHHLKEHLRIHSGEKPYECPTCRKRFSHSGSYSSHISSKKCSPIKDLPSMVPKDSAAPVKIVNGEMSPSLLPGKSKFHPGLQQEPISESYMTPLSITIPRPDAFDDKLGSDGVLPPTTPPNDAVKKVLQMVNATVSKQQQEKQNTDISKLKKTKNVPQDTPVVASPYEIKSFSSRKCSSNIPMVSPSSKSEGSSETEGKEVVYVNGNGIHNVDKSYDIVGYTLQKVHEAQAMAKCLESHHPGRDQMGSRATIQELVYPLLRKGYPIPGVHSSISRNETITSITHSKLSASPFTSSAVSHFSLGRVAETVQYNGEEMTIPMTQNDGKPCCKYCRREFESPIDAHQHERYLCDLNADVLKMKLLKSNANQNLNKYFELQRELVASMEKTSELSQSSSSSPQVSPVSESNGSSNSTFIDRNDMQREDEVEVNTELQPRMDECKETITPLSPASCSDADITKAQEQALRAFYAMQAAPSIDGLSKIASALNLNLTVVEEWFEKTRKCEENGTDPSLRGLGLVSNSHKEDDDDAPVETESIHSPRKDRNDIDVVKQHETESITEHEEEPPSPKEKESSKPPPFSVAHLISPDTPMSKSKREIQRQRTQQHASPNSHTLLKCDQQWRHKSPLDLTKSRDGDPLGRGLHPKLIYGVNYPALYHPGYMLPLYAPDPYSMAQLSIENSIKAQTNASVEDSISNRGLKRLSYVPVGCDMVSKRAKVSYGMDYPLAMPPMSGSLHGTDFYQALATASYLQAATSGGPHLPYYGFPFPHGSHLPPNGRTAQPTSTSNAMETLINSHHELLDQPGSQSTESMDKNGKTGSGLYTCSMCPKTFQKHSSLLRHVYEHSGKRPHECEVCGKAFKHKHHLMEHQRLHSGEKPYQCNRCFKKFSHSGSYSQHMNHRYSYCRRGIVGPVCKGDKFKKNIDGTSNDKEKDNGSRKPESQSTVVSDKTVSSSPNRSLLSSP